MLASWRRLVRSLRHRDFRLYFLAQAVSVVGTWMQNVAQAWLVYRLTGSSLMLGLASFFSLAPILLGGLFGGALADRVSRHRLAIVTHRVAMGQAFALAILALGGWVQVWHVMVLALVLGTTHAFGMPARHAFIAEIVPRADMANAIALHATAFNAARFLGPLLAGWLVLVSNEGVVFLLNGLSYLFFIHIMYKIERPGPVRPDEGSGNGSIAEGLRYAWGDINIRAGLLMVALVGLVGTPHAVLMPVIANEVFRGGAGTLGVLLGAAGAGSLLGAVGLAQRRSPHGLDRLIGIAGLVASVTLMAFSTSRSMWLSMAILVIGGFCLTTAVAASNTLIQLLVPDAFRGRILSLFSVTFMGASPVGNLAAGALAEPFGAMPTVAGYGLLCAVASVLYLYLTPRTELTKHLEERPQTSEAGGNETSETDLEQV